MDYRCLDKALGSYGENKIAYVQDDDNHKQSEVDLDLEKCENLMLRRALVKETMKEEHK